MLVKYREYTFRLESQPINAPPQQAYEEFTEVCKCPKCGNTMALKFLNNSYCLSCLNYPTCRNSTWLPGSVIKQATATATTCPRCGPNFKRVRFTLRSFRHSSVLNQRQLSDDGLTYETCLMCDTSFQELCDVNPLFLSPTAGSSNPIPIRDRPALNTSRAPVANRPAAPAAVNNRVTPSTNNWPVPATNNRPVPATNNWPVPATNNRPALAANNRPALPANNRPASTNNNWPTPPAPPSNNSTNEVKCTKCNQTARK